MVSPELIRRYQFFADFNAGQIVLLAKAANESRVEAEQYIFYEGEVLTQFYIVVDGKVAILIDRSDVVSTICPGEVFGWSALVPPHAATSSAKTLETSKIIAFDCRELKEEFEKDNQFACLLIQKMAQVIRDRLRDMRIESLSILARQPEF